jgi:acetyl esterase/lipase
MPSLQATVTRLLCRHVLRPYLNRDTLEATRARFASLSAPPSMVGATVEPTLAGGVAAEWLTPPEHDPERVLYYVHGGGWVACSPATHRRTVARIARRARVRALLPDYRLAPEHPFPAALDDCVAGYRHLLELGIAPSRIVIAGDSAGGALALGTLLRLRDGSLPLPAAAACIAPATDLTFSGESFTTRNGDEAILTQRFCKLAVAAYLGDSDPRHPYVSALHAELRGLPPLLIHVGTHELLLDDSVRLGQKAEQAGVNVTLKVWPGMWHVFHSFEAPESRQACAEIGDFVRTHSGG